MALPPNWTKYTTEDGKEYFHNAVTDVTQWEAPAWPAAPFDVTSSAAEVFQYEPTASDLDVPAVATLGAGSGGAGLGVQAGNAAAKGSADRELVSLNPAPSGRISASSPSTAASGGDLFAGLAFGALGGLTGAGGGAGASGGGGAGAPGAAEGGGVLGWLLGRAQQLFDVKTDDIVQRLRLVLVPYPQSSAEAKEDLRSRPDFYGPFWVATTAVLFLAATGNFARLLEEGDHKRFTADYSLVSLAAAIVYGCLLAVPLVARASLFFSGEEVGSVDFMQLICVCGYSLAPAIPVSLLCLVPLSAIRWLAVLIGLATSLLFLRSHLLADISVNTVWLKWTMLVTPCVTPVAVFLMYRLRFFVGAE